MKSTDFYRRLIEALKAARFGTTQVEIAKLLGVRQSTVSYWKTGPTQPERPTAELIAKLTGVSLDWLYTGRGAMYPSEPTDEVRELWDKLDELDPETRKKALLILRALIEG